MIQIRKITVQDTPHVQALIRGIMGTEFAKEQSAYALHDLDDPVRYYSGKKDIFLVAEKNGQVIGTVAIKEDSPDTALLRRVFVKPEFRGKGYGEKLLQKAMEFCFDHQYRTVTFRGTDRMQGALRLCLKQGFREHDVATGDDFKMFVLTKSLQDTPPYLSGR